MSKKNAVMLAISDNYSFAAANVMMSIRDNSPKVFNDCEFIIYNNGLSDQNRRVLKSIASNVRLLPMSDNNIPTITAPVYEKSKKAGQFGLEKFNALELVKEYKTVLWLESDVFVNKPIDFLFHIQCDISAVALGDVPYDAKEIDWSSDTRHCRAAVVVFNDSVLRFNITKDALKRCCLEFIDLKPFAVGVPLDEKLLGYIISYYRMNFFNLPKDYHAYCREYINRNNLADFKNASVQHFADGPDTKPWTNDSLFRALPKWADNYHKFIEMGGINYPELKDKNSFFDDTYSFNVTRSISMVRPVLGQLDILKYKLFEVDFYKDTDKLRFMFRHTNGLLFICLYWGGSAGRYSVSLNMDLMRVNQRLKNHFQNIYKIFRIQYPHVKLTQQNGIIALVIEYKDISQTNKLVNMLVKSAKSNLYRRAYLTVRKRKLIKLIIKILVDEKRYKKLKRNSTMFFADSQSVFLRFLGRLYN